MAKVTTTVKNVAEVHSIETIGEDGEILFHKLPNIIFDHVTDHRILTERFSKEDKCLHRLADIQRLSVEANSTNLEYRANPYNRRRL